MPKNLTSGAIMDAQSLLNEKYKQLCQLFGDLTYKRQAIDEQIKNVLDQIKALDISVPEVKRVEEYLKKQAQKSNEETIQN